VIVFGVVVAGPVRARDTQVPAVQRATVTITDARLVVVPSSLEPGVAVFVALNKGRKPHSLAIAGPNLSLKTAKLTAGGSARLTVNLHRGSYRLWDPVGLGKAKAHALQVKASPPPKVTRVEPPQGELGPNYSCDDDIDDVVC
jgi:hypothetical protein